jgi:hypothetical protein
LIVRQPPEHHAPHRSVEQHLTGLDETLVVAAHAPVLPATHEYQLNGLIINDNFCLMCGLRLLLS